MRMVAGPNGSGKTTLLEYLRHTFSFPLGYYLNPDEVDRELGASARLEFGSWGMRVEESVLNTFIANHPLNARAALGKISVSDNLPDWFPAL
jgi:predicted ABC-type ATPase